MGFFLQQIGKFAENVLEKGGADALQTRDADEFATNAAEAVPAQIKMFSGCQDSQTSADVHDVGSFGLPPDCGPCGAGGACTHALLKYAYSQDGNEYSWKDLLIGMRETLSHGSYTQIPQLSSSRQMNLDEPFCLDTNGDAGKKKALLIGINYVGQQGELRGCHNDVDSMVTFLESQGFIGDACEVKILRDNGEDDEPTRANITEGLKWLADGAEEGDALFLHYSGHGSRMKDRDGDEDDKYDETLVPLDYATAGQIPDDEINRELVLDLPEGCCLNAVMDCCHSGTILDLPYSLKVNGEVEEQLQNGDLHNLMENNGFFGKVIQAAVRWVAENPDMGQEIVGKASELARGLGVNLPPGFGSLFG